MNLSRALLAFEGAFDAPAQSDRGRSGRERLAAYAQGVQRAGRRRFGAEWVLLVILAAARIRC